MGLIGSGPLGHWGCLEGSNLEGTEPSWGDKDVGPFQLCGQCCDVPGCARDRQRRDRGSHEPRFRQSERRHAKRPPPLHAVRLLHCSRSNGYDVLSGRRKRADLDRRLGALRRAGRGLPADARPTRSLLLPATCTIRVAFQPTAPGAATGVLTTGGPSAELHGTGIPSSSTQPSNQFTFGKVKLNRTNGTATLTVKVPGPGTLSLGGKGLVAQRLAAARQATPGRIVSAAGKGEAADQAQGQG
jgi:hypothetical protein